MHHTAKCFEVFDIKNKKVFEIQNLAEFCRKNDLSEICMRDVAKKRQYQHKGYIVRECGDYEYNFEHRLVEWKNKTTLKTKCKITKQERYKQSDEYIDFQNNIEKYYKKYHIEQRMSCFDIAKMIGANPEMVRLCFVKNGFVLKRYNKTKLGLEHPNFLVLNEEQKLFLQDFKKEFNQLHYKQNLSIAVIADKYKLSPVTIVNYCKKHNIEYNRNNTVTIPHNKLIDFFKQNNISYEINKKILGRKEADIFLPKHNLAIEVNGVYWHSDLFLERNFHLNKTEEFRKQGVELLHFWDEEINKKFDIVVSIIKNKLGISEKKIFARKTIVKKLPYNECKDFLNDNHIQGSKNSNINYGLFFENELVEVMCFRKNIQGIIEMSRLCTKRGYNIVGGTSKLFGAFINEYHPKKVISFCDKRIFNGKVYETLGFKHSHDTKPNYWYFKNKIESRQKYQKHKLKTKLSFFDEKISEYENMMKNGFLRIFDCGNKCYVYRCS